VLMIIICKVQRITSDLVHELSTKVCDNQFKKMNTTVSYCYRHVRDGANSSGRDVSVIAVMCTVVCYADCVFEEYTRAVRSLA
jgi:hypothetical protein